MGALLLLSERFTRFGNPAWPGVRTANFAAFGSWSEALLKDTESLRDSDALMRIAVPKALCVLREHTGSRRKGGKVCRSDTWPRRVSETCETLRG